jgi:hypothetical protein
MGGEFQGMIISSVVTQKFVMKLRWVRSRVLFDRSAVEVVRAA